MTNTELLELAESQASICGVFGNAKRLLILWALGKHEMSVSEIASAIDCSLQNTSQHLRLMKDKDILASRREGQAIYYRIKQNEFMEGCQLLFQARQGLFTQEKPVEST
ncbi:MAG: metalloregulator ArsR/SmtB family transcription factor [Anaerolineae bacterium]|jgi:DNA-binding transcriptional ArsR family regulator